MVVLLVLLLACGRGSAGSSEPAATPAAAPASAAAPARTGPLANVMAVQASGEPGAYTFAVTVYSPDSGCDRFADWWEVASPDGRLLYRRVLLHSHVGEQPFTRSGGPVPVAADQTVVVRAHLSTGGYGGKALRGSVSGGFGAAADIGAEWASTLATEEPLPTGCAW